MNKWVYSIYGLHLHQLIIDMERLGYNGLVIQIPDHITELEWTHQFFAPLKAHCENHNIEIIPLMCGIGKLSPYLQRTHPEWMEFKPAGAEYDYRDGRYELMTETPGWHRPASVIHSDGQVQVAGCMNEPNLRNWYKSQIGFLHQHLQFNKIFFSLDEIRAGGTCQRCKNGLISQLLANTANNLISECEGIECYAWGDMFDPTHNAKHPYYHLAGSTEGALDLILEAHPDFKVVHWGLDPIWLVENRIEHMISVNVDKESIDRYQGLDTSGRAGYQYTTWKGDYSKLVEFSKYWGGKE